MGISDWISDVCASDLYRGAVNRLQFVDDVISSEIGMDGRLPWEEVRDWFHLAGNYVDAIDRAAERMAEELWRQDEIGAGAIAARLRERHEVTVELTSRAENTRLLRRYDRRTRTLTLSGAMPPDRSSFALARSEERLVGKECVRTCSTRWA